MRLNETGSIVRESAVVFRERSVAVQWQWVNVGRWVNNGARANDTADDWCDRIDFRSFEGAVGKATWQTEILNDSRIQSLFGNCAQQCNTRRSQSACDNGEQAQNDLEKDLMDFYYLLVFTLHFHSGGVSRETRSDCMRYLHFHFNFFFVRLQLECLLEWMQELQCSIDGTACGFYTNIRQRFRINRIAIVEGERSISTEQDQQVQK